MDVHAQHIEQSHPLRIDRLFVGRLRTGCGVCFGPNSVTFNDWENYVPWSKLAILMSSTSTTTLSIALGLMLLIAGCSSSQQPASTEAPTTGVSGDPQVSSILQSSCFQCHSSSGRAPWYAAVSPTYLAANSARGVLNFSDWQTYDTEKRAAELKSIEQAIRGGSMPPGDYTALDHTAGLTDDQKQVLLKWAAQPAH
jgi:uncharacterized membrane protein